MSQFFERLQAALLPDYELLRELGHGGMGTVWLVRDMALDCLRAVKVLDQRLYTAANVRRFVDEAQILANLRHNNIVVVHEVGESDGLNFYVMEYLEGETLESRLEKRGRLPVDAAREFGRDLLGALRKAHRSGVIHRDVKPGNVFLGQEGTVLTDFGIARLLIKEQVTESGVQMGTMAYMAPEQFADVEADELTDLYAAGMVIYEAFTGTRWGKCPPEKGDWSGIPSNIVRVLKRALELERHKRWPDADAFRQALWHTRSDKYRWRTLLLTCGGVVAGVVLWRIAGPALLGWLNAGPRIQIDHFAFSNPAASERGLSDSLACSLSAALARYPDVEVRGPCESPWSWFRRKTLLQGQLYSTGDVVRLIVGPQRRPWTVAASLRVASWHDGVEDLAAVLYDSLLGGIESPQPRAILPKNPAAWKAFLDGEHDFARALWGTAYAAYGTATALDSSCWLCYWRHAEVGRWMSLSQDTADVGPYRRAIKLFPEPYRRLIVADSLPLERRLDGFADVARRWPDFFFGRFRSADESFHRGPLVGRPRRQAISAFGDVLALRHGDFGPAWEHLAWVAIAEGDSADAERAIDTLRATGPSRDPIAAQVRALLEVAYACRFFDIGRCDRVIVEQLRGAEAAGGTTVDAGARWLPFYDAQTGAIELGRMLGGRPELARSVSLAQAFAEIGLGRLDSARALLRRAAERFGDSDLSLFADELDAVLVAFDPDSERLAGGPAVMAALTERATLSTTPADERLRAAWMLTVVSSRLGNHAGVEAARKMLDTVPVPDTLARLLDAIRAASRNDLRDALRVSEPLIELEASASDPDPFFRTVLHLLRADWYQRLSQTEGVRRELIWYQNSDVYRYPVDRPQLAEVDWAFGPFARWRLAQLSSEDACRASRDVVRLWATGDPLYRARADSAAQRHVALACPETS